MRPENTDNTSQLCSAKWHYVASEWELGWHSFVRAHEDSSRNWAGGCRLLRNESVEVDKSLAMAKQRDRHARGAWDYSVLSHHRIVNGCTGEIIERVPIEPLVGFLRHPRLLCFPLRVEDRDPLFGDLMFAPHHLLPIWRAEIVPSPSPPRRSFLFDLGAQFYRVQHLGWFLEAYTRRGIAFDRILAWELMEPEHWVRPGALNETASRLAPTKAALVLDTYPLEALDRLSYFNVPVTTPPDHRYNPWRVMRSLATAEDFVVVKLECAALHPAADFAHPGHAGHAGPPHRPCPPPHIRRLPRRAPGDSLPPPFSCPASPCRQHRRLAH